MQFMIVQPATVSAIKAFVFEICPQAKVFLQVDEAVHSSVMFTNCSHTDAALNPGVRARVQTRNQLIIGLTQLHTNVRLGFRVSIVR